MATSCAAWGAIAGHWPGCANNRQVELTILAEGNIALTARGRARIVQEPMATAHDYAAVAMDVHDIDDHRQAEFLVESGVDRHWVDKDERRALGERLAALRELANGRSHPEAGAR